MHGNPENTEIDAAFKVLHGHVVELFAMWLMHKGLYRSDDTLRNMNTVSSTGFSLIRNALTHEIIRLTCALTDPAGKGKYANLSLLGVASMLPLSDMSSEAVRVAREAIAAAEAIRTHRNKRLMHFDRDIKLKMSEYFAAEVQDPGSRPLPAISWQSIDTCVELVGEAANRIGDSLGHPVSVYEWTDISNATGALSWTLRDSIRLQKLRAISFRTEVDDRILRMLVQQRSDRRDSQILGSLELNQDDE